MRARYGRRERTVRRERADAQSRSTRPARLTRGGGERDSKGLSLLVLALLGGGRAVFLLGLGHALLELLHARAEGLGELRQPVRPEEDEHDDQDNQQFLIAQTKHWGLLSALVTLARPYPPRKTRRSPTRAVTRRPSKYSSSGMAYLREIPSRSLMSPGPMSFRSPKSATSFSWMVSRAAG